MILLQKTDVNEEAQALISQIESFKRKESVCTIISLQNSILSPSGPGKLKALTLALASHFPFITTFYLELITSKKE